MVAAAAVGALLAVLLLPPAAWLDGALERASYGRIRLAQTEGTLWRGSARLVLIDPAASPDPPVLGGMALPGRLHWSVDLGPVLEGAVGLALRLDGMERPLRIRLAPGSLAGSGGTLDLPSLPLERLGSPWNTIQPAGRVSIRWSEFTLEPDGFSGRVTAVIREVTSSLSPVRPLGAYQVEFDGSRETARFGMVTLEGPLRIEGDGTWTPRGGLRFAGMAWADEEQEARLAPLLGLIGRRAGNRTMIRVGA
ncbi:MAG: type II secretion system protein N [Burkholderiales bacterium]|nr:MAG: type II secretion system protein N [Burkholderiales bacterium]